MHLRVWNPGRWQHCSLAVAGSVGSSLSESERDTGAAGIAMTADGPAAPVHSYGVVIFGRQATSLLLSGLSRTILLLFAVSDRLLLLVRTVCPS